MKVTEKATPTSNHFVQCKRMQQHLKIKKLRRKGIEYFLECSLTLLFSRAVKMREVRVTQNDTPEKA